MQIALPQQKPYEFRNVSINQICKDSESYADVFKEHGLLAFRQAHWDQIQATLVAQAIGKHCGFVAQVAGSDDQTGYWQYEQQHDRIVAGRMADGCNFAHEQVIEWHLEGPSLKQSQRAAGWNMHHFTCDSSTGMTGFVDMAKLWQRTPDEYKSLLQNAQVIHLINWQHHPEDFHVFYSEFEQKVRNGEKKIWTLDGDRYVTSFARPAVDVDPATNRVTLLTCPCATQAGFQDFLLSVEGKSPTPKQLTLFAYFMEWLRYEVSCNQDQQEWWSWTEGDFLLPNLFSYAHGVRGGFAPGTRTFTGMWCFPSTVGREPTEWVPATTQRPNVE